ncbi:MAG: hypothetical protein QXV17_01495 [Candidatus Micrarchaeaceae archaeon]
MQSTGETYITFGQKGNKIFDPNKPSDYSAFIVLHVLNSNDTVESQILSENASSSTTENQSTGNNGLNSQTYMNTRGGLEDVLNQYLLYFTYDFFSNENSLPGLSIENSFSSPIEDQVNQILSNPMMQEIGMIGQSSGIADLLNPLAKMFGMTGSDLFSMIFLSKIKTIKIWQGGDVTLDIPLSLTFLDYDNDPFNNVILPVFLLYLIAGYHRIPFSIDSNSAGWIQTLNSIITLTIGPMFFTLQMGNFLRTDKNNALAITKMNSTFTALKNGLPTVANVTLTLSNINPIVLEDYPLVGNTKVNSSSNIQNISNSE